MRCPFSTRIKAQRESFIKEILRFTQQPEVISFAGGIPNPDLFPVKEIRDIAHGIIEKYGTKALQYGLTEGYPPLREAIAHRYSSEFNFPAKPENVLITSGSQQGLDLIGKVFLDPEDRVLLESPSYLGAIQAFSLYQPELTPIPLVLDGIDQDLFRKQLNQKKPKLFYTVPNFQNPSGLTYSLEKRQETAKMIEEGDMLLVEDDPYKELRFAGEDLPVIGSFIKDRALLLGSFSKTIIPGLRVGMMVGPEKFIAKLVTAKQACDVHTSIFSQLIIYEYLNRFDLEKHVKMVRSAFRRGKEAMIDAIRRHFPEEVAYTDPQGGMFIWCTLPSEISARVVLKEALSQGVAFVPGEPFYIRGGNNCFRLNFTATGEEDIQKGIKVLGAVLKKSIPGKIKVANM